MNEASFRVSSNKTKQLLLLGGLALVGAIQILAFAGLRGVEDANVGAGFLLGVVIVGVAVVGLALGRSRSISVDAEERTLTIEDSSRLGSKRQTIPFGDVREIELDTSGEREGGSPAYDVVLTLRSGRKIHLFRGAFFDDRNDPRAMERTRALLLERIGLPAR